MTSSFCVLLFCWSFRCRLCRLSVAYLCSVVSMRLCYLGSGRRMFAPCVVLGKPGIVGSALVERIMSVFLQS